MAGIEDVATYLDLKPAELVTQLRSGKSLADIATAQGKTVDGLKTAITDAATKQLDAAVTAGKLTKDQETKMLAGLAKHIDDLVNGVHKPGGFGFGHGHGGWKGDEKDKAPTAAAARRARRLGAGARRGLSDSRRGLSSSPGAPRKAPACAFRGVRASTR